MSIALELELDPSNLEGQCVCVIKTLPPLFTSKSGPICSLRTSGVRHQNGTEVHVNQLNDDENLTPVW